jgi:hypothetical protein
MLSIHRVAPIVAYQTWDSHAPVRSVFVIEPGVTDGKVLDYRELTWWVQIRNAAGRIGWTSHTDDFDGKDALGT